jgi:hypothetical protein
MNRTLSNLDSSNKFYKEGYITKIYFSKILSKYESHMMDNTAVKSTVRPGCLRMRALKQKGVSASKPYLEHVFLELRSEYALKFMIVLIKK